MKLFYGVSRKLALLPLATFSLGWLIYLVGFLLLTVSDDEDRYDNISNRTTSFNHISHYLAAGSGPILVVVSISHAALPGLLGSLLGLLSAIMGVLYVSSVGYALYTSALVVYTSFHKDDLDFEDFELNGDINNRDVLMLLGGLSSCISWTAVLMLWNFFVSNWEVNDSRTLLRDDDHVEGSLRRGNRNSKRAVPFAGVARKLAVVLLVAMVGSWCVFVLGIDMKDTTCSLIYSSYSEPALSFAVWAVSTVGVLLVISAVMHAGTTRDASTVMGVFTSLLSSLFVVCMGHVTFGLGISLYDSCSEDFCSMASIHRYELYQLFGGLGTLVCWACVCALWPFYSKAPSAAGSRRWQADDVFVQSEERIPLLHDHHSKREQHKPSNIEL